MVIDSERYGKIEECFTVSRHCVVSTNSRDGWPESAVVGFCAHELEVVFATWKSTRKYKNLERDNRASFVFGLETGVTVQYEGHAEMIEKTSPLVALYLARKPSARKYMDDPSYVFFNVIPTWVKYSDFRTDPIESFEVGAGTTSN